MKHSYFPRRRSSQFGFERGNAVSHSASPDLFALIRRTKYTAIQTGLALLREVSDDLKYGESSYLEFYWERLPFLFNVVEMANEAIRLVRENKPAPSQEVEPAVPEYIIGSWFLSKCASYLTSQPNGHERLHLVTGSKISHNSRTLDHMVKVKLASESAINALADQHELQKALIEMDEWGHHLHGLFHSHPGTGAWHTQPSKKDLTTHERYERGGYPMIGAIFVKDGFVRFFANHPFTITVFGKGVNQIDEHIFTIHNLPNQAP